MQQVKKADRLDCWSSLFCYLTGFVNDDNRITTERVVEIAENVATTVTGRRYILGNCSDLETRQFWISNLEYWKQFDDKTVTLAAVGGLLDMAKCRNQGL
jgi:pimeloyl-CoA synthetase